MPLTKSEIMYLGLGLALGAAAGANWDKIKQALGPLLDSAGKGFGDAYADVAEKFADVVETAQDAAAQRSHDTSAARANGRTRKGAGGRAAAGRSTGRKSTGRKSTASKSTASKSTGSKSTGRRKASPAKKKTRAA